MNLFKSRKCRNARNVRKILNWTLSHDEFNELRYKATTFPVVYDKWGFKRKQIMEV